MLVDTSGLMCLHNQAEPLHEEAVDLLEAVPVRLTHNYVIAEFVALANSRRLQRRPTFQFIREIETKELIDVEYVTRDLHESALELLERRLDKSWSLCDAVSILLMQERGLQEALTTDHHFEQAGMTRFLK